MRGWMGQYKRNERRGCGKRKEKGRGKARGRAGRGMVGYTHNYIYIQRKGK